MPQKMTEPDSGTKYQNEQRRHMANQKVYTIES